MKRMVLILSLIFAYILMSPYVVFAVSNIDQLAEEYTSDDYYEVSGQSIDIMEYPNQWNGLDIGRGSGYGQRNIQNGNTYFYDDNDIVKIIPKDLFFQVGYKHYLGLEYGFYINTTLIDQNTYRSTVAVYNIDFTVIDHYNEETICDIRMVFNCIYEGLLRGTNNLYNNLIVEDKNKVVVYLANQDAINYNDEIKLENISVELEIENRDFPNPGDVGYQLVDNFNLDILDKGDFITEHRLLIDGDDYIDFSKYLQDRNMENIIDTLTSHVVDYLISNSLPPFLEESIDYIVGEIIPTTNIEDYIVGEPVEYILDYGGGYNQIIQDNNFVKGSKIKINSNVENESKVRFGVGDSVTSITKILGPTDPKNCIVQKLTYNVSFNLIDPNNGNCGDVEYYQREFYYTRNLIPCMTNSVYNSEIDINMENKYFYYYSSDNIDMNIQCDSLSDILLKVYDYHTGDLLYSSLNNLSIILPGASKYIIECIGEPGLDFSIQITNQHLSHKYGYEYQRFSSSKHYSLCYCGEKHLENHVINASDTSLLFANCIFCGQSIRVSDDIGAGMMSSVKRTVNGSYILNDGTIVLVEDDILEYLNGELVFYDTSYEGTLS